MGIHLIMIRPTTTNSKASNRKEEEEEEEAEATAEGEHYLESLHANARARVAQQHDAAHQRSSDPKPHGVSEAIGVAVHRSVSSRRCGVETRPMTPGASPSEGQRH